MVEKVSRVVELSLVLHLNTDYALFLCAFFSRSFTCQSVLVITSFYFNLLPSFCRNHINALKSWWSDWATSTLLLLLQTHLPFFLNICYLFSLCVIVCAIVFGWVDFFEFFFQFRFSFFFLFAYLMLFMLWKVSTDSLNDLIRESLNAFESTRMVLDISQIKTWTFRKCHTECEQRYLQTNYITSIELVLWNISVSKTHIHVFLGILLKYCIL